MTVVDNVRLYNCLKLESSSINFLYKKLLFSYQQLFQKHFMENHKLNLIDWFKALSTRQKIALLFGLLVFINILSKTSNNHNPSVKSKQLNNETQNCTGTKSCIDKVRESFTNTGKTILGEEYLDNGNFGISFMDSQHPGAFNSTVSTDCNCNIVNANVTTIN